MRKAIIIAKEKNEAMKSQIPTIFHEIIDKPIISKIVDNFAELEFDDVTTVIAPQMRKVKEILPEQCQLLMTTQSVFDYKLLKSLIKDEEGVTFITRGNIPNVTKTTYLIMEEKLAEYPMVVLTTNERVSDDQDIVLRNPRASIRSMIKYADATLDQREIKEVNTNVYAFKNKMLFDYLNANAQDTDLFDPAEIISWYKEDQHQVLPYMLNGSLEALAIRSREDLVKASNWERVRIINHWLANGVTIYNSDSVVIGNDVKIDHDTVIYQNNTIVGKTVIGKYNTLEVGNYIDNSTIGLANTIEQSRIVNSHIKDHNSVGPWANLRESVSIGSKNRIGTSVELKKVSIQDNNAVAHNVYLGNTEVGSGCNIGWGVVTANYDGNHKYNTTIGNNTFVGSSSTLIAPMQIGDHVVIAAGSTVYGEVNNDDMVIARARPVVKTGRGKQFLEGDK